ncbi:MAG: heavy-metal-associated domain-containing protein [Myxococcaceae bacterium]
MKTWKGFVVACALMSSAPALAAEVQVTIKGMVCSFCATGLKKTLGAEKGIQAVNVSLEKKRVTLQVDPKHAPSDDRIRELVKDAGYDVVSVERPEEKAVQGSAS